MGADEGCIVTSSGATPTANTPDELLARLRDEIPRALPTALTTSGSSPAAGNDLYEAFLFALVLRAARAEGYMITFENGLGQPPTSFRLRRSPGRLSTGGSFTHAVLHLPNSTKDALEVHTGVKVVGRSKVAHEADVLVLPSTVAQRCRQLGVDPPCAKANLVVEGKYYSQPVCLGTGREFLGLDYELRKAIFAATITSETLVHLLQGAQKRFEVGVLPGLKAERDLQERFAQVLRGYRNAP